MRFNVTAGRVAVITGVLALVAVLSGGDAVAQGGRGGWGSSSGRSSPNDAARVTGQILGAIGSAMGGQPTGGQRPRAYSPGGPGSLTPQGFNNAGGGLFGNPNWMSHQPHYPSNQGNWGNYNVQPNYNPPNYNYPSNDYNYGYSAPNNDTGEYSAPSYTAPDEGSGYAPPAPDPRGPQWVAAGSVVLVNPADSGTTVYYRLAGYDYEMPPGYSQTLEGSNWTIDFNRGGSFGRQQYTLAQGTYHFTGTTRGWELYAQNQ